MACCLQVLYTYLQPVDALQDSGSKPLPFFIAITCTSGRFEQRSSMASHPSIRSTVPVQGQLPSSPAGPVISLECA